MQEQPQFKSGVWEVELNVRDFVSQNVTPYDGDSSFLSGPTEKTKRVWEHCLQALKEERENPHGVRSIDTSTISGITAFAPGYIDKDNEVIVGLQTDQVLRRAMKPFGGYKVVEKAVHENGLEVDPRVTDIFTHYRKTHNDGVFDVYTDEIRSFRSNSFLTGLPDNYARGRIIGDYRRLALYGADRLIAWKKEDLAGIHGPMTEHTIRLREEVAEQIRALKKIFAGDPTWVTESIGGRLFDGRHKVTKTSFRFLQTLYNLGPSPEPNLTVLWSPSLPEGFKEFAAQVSIDTSSIQYENDDLMRSTRHSDDYGIACCVSYQEIGKQIQFFGARTNLAKALLLAVNGGRCEISGTLMVEGIPELKGDVLDFNQVWDNYLKVLKVIARVYNDSMNIIHYMHDKYYYEAAQMAFIDTDPKINLAYGVAGLSIAADSLSAIRYAKVTPIRNEQGLTEDFKIEGEFPCYGNDDDRADTIAYDITHIFSGLLKELPVYKNAEPTLSVLTITSNVMYGKKTGATPDGRGKGVAFAPGANPMHGRDNHGAIASLSSVAKLDYTDAADGISNTFSIIPHSLGSSKSEQNENLISMMDGYFTKGAHHLNVNVLNREMLEDAMVHPENYPQLTIRVSGYAVNFVKLSREHQLEVISRSFHKRMR